MIDVTNRPSPYSTDLTGYSGFILHSLRDNHHPTVLSFYALRDNVYLYRTYLWYYYR